MGRLHSYATRIRAKAMILVVGATGLLGSEICRLLTAQGKRVRGLLRVASDPTRPHASTGRSTTHYSKLARAGSRACASLIKQLHDPKTAVFLSAFRSSFLPAQL